MAADRFPGLRYPSQVALCTRLGVKLVEEERTPEQYFDTVIEASGTARGLLGAKNAVRPGGTIVLKSTYKGEVSLNLSEFVVDEIRLIGSRCGPFGPAMNLLEKGLVDPQPLIAGSYSLEKGIEAFQSASEPGALKILLELR